MCGMKEIAFMAIGDPGFCYVEIEEHNNVHDLKEAIKEKNRYRFPAHHTTLYLAKQDGQWLSTDDKRLRAGDIPALMDSASRMEAELELGLFGFPDIDEAGEGEFHVLVRLPAYFSLESHRISYAQESMLSLQQSESSASFASSVWGLITASPPSVSKKNPPSKKDV